MWQMYRSGYAESIIGAIFNVFNDKVIVTTNNTRLVTLFESSGSYCAVGSTIRFLETHPPTPGTLA